MAVRRSKIKAPPIREHQEGEYDAAIATAFAPGTVLYEMAIEGAMEENYGQTEFERGVVEGGRRMLLNFIYTAIDYKVKEKSNVTAGSQ